MKPTQRFPSPFNLFLQRLGISVAKSCLASQLLSALLVPSPARCHGPPSLRHRHRALTTEGNTVWKSKNPNTARQCPAEKIKFRYNTQSRPASKENPTVPKAGEQVTEISVPVWCDFCTGSACDFGTRAGGELHQTATQGEAVLCIWRSKSPFHKIDSHIICSSGLWI